MVCAHCGCDNPEGIAYCRDCGMTLRAYAPRVAAPTPTPEIAAGAGHAGQARSPPSPQPAWSHSPGEAPAHVEPSSPGDTACPVCREPNPFESRFCHACGAAFETPRAPVGSLPVVVGRVVPPASPARSPGAGAAASEAAVVCVRCHGVAEVGADYCKFCGARLNQPESQPERAPPASPPSRVFAPSIGPGARGAHVGVAGMAGLEAAAAAAQDLELDLPVSFRAPATPRIDRPVGGFADRSSPRVEPLGAPLAIVAPQPPSAPTGPMERAAPSEPQPSRPTVPPREPHAATRPLHGVDEAAPFARLVRIAKDGSEGGHYAIFGEQTDIGRSEGSVVLPEDAYMSPRHARIAMRTAPGTPGTGNGAAGRTGSVGGRPELILIDLASVNGVFLRLRAPHTLAHGDLLLLGQQVLRFEAVSEVEGARGPAMQHGVLLFGSPAPIARARLIQRTVEGLVRDVVYLVRDEVVVGRESGDRTFPDDAFMSRRHAAFVGDIHGYSVHDLGSSNGTFVQIQKEHVLRDGDQFRIGHHLFRVDLPAPGGAA